MTRVRKNPAAVAALLSEPLAARTVTLGAADVADAAREIVPVDKGWSREGYTHTVAKLTPHGLVATAYTTEVTGSLFEWGGGNLPPLAPLRRGAERVGFHLSPGRSA